MLVGHNGRLLERTNEYREKVRKSVLKWHKEVGHSQETKDKIRESQKKNKQLFSQQKMGVKNPMYGKTPSEEVKEKIRIKLKGSNAWNWQGGVAYYRGEDWNEKRKLCYKRDKYICQDCGIVRSKSLLAAHHLIAWRLTKDNSLENLITLCLKCHGKRHGRPKNDKQ